MPFSSWSGSTLFAILSSLIKVYTTCHSQYDQSPHHLPFSAVWSRSTLSFSVVWSVCTLFFSSLIKVNDVFTVILRNSLIRVYTVCHYQQSDQGLHCLPFSAVWSVSMLFVILSKQSDQGLYCLPLTFWSGSTLLAFPRSLIRDYIVILSSLMRAYTICNSMSDEGLHYLPFSPVASVSTLFAILSKKFYQVLHCLQFLAVWSGCTLFTIFSSLIRVYTVSHSQQSD